MEGDETQSSPQANHGFGMFTRGEEAMLTKHTMASGEEAMASCNVNRNQGHLRKPWLSSNTSRNSGQSGGQPILPGRLECPHLLDMRQMSWAWPVGPAWPAWPVCHHEILHRSLVLHHVSDSEPCRTFGTGHRSPLWALHCAGRFDSTDVRRPCGQWCHAFLGRGPIDTLQDPTPSSSKREFSTRIF